MPRQFVGYVNWLTTIVNLMFFQESSLGLSLSYYLFYHYVVHKLNDIELCCVVKLRSNYIFNGDWNRVVIFKKFWKLNNLANHWELIFQKKIYRLPGVEASQLLNLMFSRLLLLIPYWFWWLPHRFEIWFISITVELSKLLLCNYGLGLHSLDCSNMILKTRTTHHFQ